MLFFSVTKSVHPSIEKEELHRPIPLRGNVTKLAVKPEQTLFAQDKSRKDTTFCFYSQIFMSFSYFHTLFYYNLGKFTPTSTPTMHSSHPFISIFPATLQFPVAVSTLHIKKQSICTPNVFTAALVRRKTKALSMERYQISEFEGIRLIYTSCGVVLGYSTESGLQIISLFYGLGCGIRDIMLKFACRQRMSFIYVGSVAGSCLHLQYLVNFCFYT